MLQRPVKWARYEGKSAEIVLIKAHLSHGSCGTPC